MKLKLNQELKGIDGVEILKGEKGKPLTFRDICISSVLTPNQDDDEKKKWEKYEIYKKIRDAKDTVDLKVEEIATIKKCIGKTGVPLIMGQCWEMLEGIGSSN